jgi:P4 family phage/plasmid primase-like protien
MMRKSDAHPTEIAMFYGKRLVTAIECEGGQRLRESFVKLMTGGDLVAARRMKEDFWQMAPTWHIHVSFNEPPTITGTDDGIRRRLKMVPWQAKFEGAHKDPHLKERLESEQHRAAILNWCLAGMSDYLLNGIPEAAAVSHETDAYIFEQDLLGNFITECCTADGGQVQSTEFVKSFHYWLDSRGEHPGAWKATRIGRELKRRGFTSHREMGGVARGKTFYEGLTLDVLAPSER